MIRELTTVVVVDAIEPALTAWRALGFAVVAEVPHGDRLGFVILAGPPGQVMLQTRDSVRDDLGIEPPAVLLYAKVASVDAVPPEAGAVFIADRTTFYGARERWVRDPSGTVIGFAVSPS